MPEQTQWTLRLPADTLKSLKDGHAKTFAQHRLSFNAWVLAMIHTGVKSVKWPRTHRDVPREEK